MSRRACPGGSSRSSRSIDVKLGEVVTVYYPVTNEPPARPSGQAGYNVSPPTAGIYFTKINCFCFTEQTMKPGEKRDMAVVFYVDPKLVDEFGAGRLSPDHAVLYVLSGARSGQAAAESPPPKSGRI